MLFKFVQRMDEAIELALKHPDIRPPERHTISA
jgi:hypothetical protein